MCVFHMIMYCSIVELNQTEIDNREYINEFHVDNIDGM